MTARRDPLRELALLLRAPEPGTNNLGAFVAEHAKALAPLLGVPESKLTEEEPTPDEVLAPELFDRLRALRDAERAYVARRGESLAIQAAECLIHTACWDDERVIIDADVLLGGLVADRGMNYVRFVLDDDASVTVSRASLAGCRLLPRLFMDVAAWVDRGGVHLRWRSGRGGINWRPRETERWEESLVLIVSLRRPAVAALPRRRVPSLLGDVLRDLGWPA